MQNNNEIMNSQFKDNETLNIREEIEKYVFYWKWFLLGIIIAIISAFLYLRYSSSLYSATATILIKDNKKAGISKELAAFEDLGIIGGGSSNNTDNEIEILRSRKIVGQVVDTLDLHITYFIEGRVIKSEIYNNNPIKLKLVKESTNFKKDTIIIVSVIDNNEFYLKDLNKNVISEHKFNKEFKLDIGLFQILRTDIKLKEKSNDIFINIRKKPIVIDTYRENVNISPVNKKISN